jgi:hypothetical protein
MLEHHAPSPSPSPALQHPDIGSGLKTDLRLTSAPKPADGRRAAWLDAFEAFWLAYPRRVQKKAALRAWLALLPKSKSADLIKLYDRILALLLSRSKDWETRDKHLVPHPATWLRAEDFQEPDDEP